MCANSSFRHLALKIIMPRVHFTNGEIMVMTLVISYFVVVVISLQSLLVRRNENHIRLMQIHSTETLIFKIEMRAKLKCRQLCAQNEDAARSLTLLILHRSLYYLVSLLLFINLNLQISNRNENHIWWHCTNGQ